MAGTFPAVEYDPVEDRLVAVDVPVPDPGAGDLLVEIAAVSVNPVDLKQKQRHPKDAGRIRLGYDAVGRVRAVGEGVSGFAPGDRVWYAGDATRPGTNGALHLVDYRLVSTAPEGVSDEDAAAMPLTSITAWEAMFERMGYATEGQGQAPMLMINGAGGVGSVALQLARRAGIAATATASRDESRDWCLRHGAAEVVDHAALGDLADSAFGTIFCAHSTAHYLPEMARLVRPHGTIVSIVGAPEPLDTLPLFRKSAAFAYEYMFARSLHNAEPERQGAILDRVARLMEAGEIVSTRTGTLQGLTPETIGEAHRRNEAGGQIGKLVIVA
ncbi:zinc-binding alcohol dehydrogenase family protein [Wenxinia marina]|uniref:NADPH:quinone reductase n=1 Tax=Wenxinia marina DSM 24838 TaxID=1123501 RepID=A0A0D0Q6U9_9RHOB|nr:zinc-binding alcohol dehydrogenase family protein [Wenxinia marina]KIQ68157.1 NADPH:quinone reductase [Wenxinia marina DSM 24838]GGL76276.1 NADPH:quinone reductase [Wenxinia marina]